MRAIEGAHEAVAAVTAQRCICSNSRTERIEFMLEKTRLLPFFAGRIFSSLETPTRQAEAGARRVPACRARRSAPIRRNTFVIEDSVHGIAGAKAAGMRVIGFTGAAHSYPGHADALTEAGAETVIRRWADFPA